MTADKLVKAYIKIRAARQQLLHTFEEQDNDLKAQQELVSEKLMDWCKEVGADSIKTAHGTVSRKVTTRYWPSDWGSMYEFIKEHEAFQLMEQRVHQTNMKKFLEDHPDLMPMGLNSDSRYTISVRKA
jgi:hypothetical protein